MKSKLGTIVDAWFALIPVLYIGLFLWARSPATRQMHDVSDDSLLSPWVGISLISMAILAMMFATLLAACVEVDRHATGLRKLGWYCILLFGTPIGVPAYYFVCQRDRWRAMLTESELRWHRDRRSMLAVLLPFLTVVVFSRLFHSLIASAVFLSAFVGVTVGILTIRSSSGIISLLFLAFAINGLCAITCVIIRTSERAFTIGVKTSDFVNAIAVVVFCAVIGTLVALSIRVGRDIVKEWWDR